MFKKITIIGVGLIGGSIGRAVRKKKLAKKVVGVCRRESSKRRALKYRTVNQATLDMEEGVKGADLVILAAPIGKIPALAEEAVIHMDEGAILTDVGSAKKDIVSELEKIAFGRVCFVGSHPMAGSEKSGPMYANERIFQGKNCFVTRTSDTDENALLKLKRFWKRLGAKPIEVSPEEHDRIAAKISHVVHLVASGLVLSSRDVLKFAASGFCDTTRIALSDPELWRDISFANNRQIARSLKELIVVLKEFASCLARKNTRKIQALLDEAKALRSELGCEK